MAVITHTCVQCGKQLTIPERYQGRALKCPECGNPFRVEPPPREESQLAPPLASPAPTPPAPPPLEARAMSIPAPPPTPALAPAPAAFADAPFQLQEPAATQEAAQAPPTLPVTPGAPLTEPAASAPVYWRLARVDVLSVAKVAAVVYAGLGVIVGVVIAIAAFVPKVPLLPILRGGLAILAVVGAPIVYGIIGFIVGAVIATIYNLAARLTGGISFLLE